MAVSKRTWTIALLVGASMMAPAWMGQTGTAVAGQNSRAGGAWADRLIERAFADVARRAPDPDELRRYRVRVYEDHWTEDDIRNDLRERRDYMSHGDRTSRDRDGYDVDRTIRNAHRDIVGRDPDDAGMRDYRGRVTERGWTERQVRQSMRESSDYRSNPSASADRIITRAYQDLLGRAPDASGMASFRNQIVEHGWDEHDVRNAIMNSPEYRQKDSGVMTEQRAREVVRRAYLSVLGREPDPGSAGFVQHVLRDHWTEREVARELRNSDEFRNKQQ